MRELQKVVDVISHDEDKHDAILWLTVYTTTFTLNCM